MSIEASQSNFRRYAPIGKYDLLSHIATGGMAAIYKAVDGETGQVVALKILSPDLATRPNALERFRREAQRGIKLRHPNLVSIYEFGETRGLAYLALELVDGVDLHEFISRKDHLDPDEAIHVLTQAARALDYLHQQGVVHRDIKPSNFMISQVEGQLLVQLTDLGLAREVNDEDFRVTRDGHTVGTIDYMSPEQARDSGLADIRSDIYSLGCTLHHMLAGRPPFPEGGLTERLYKHAEDEPPDIRRINPAVTPGLAGMLRRMLAKKPTDRYQTPADLLADLARVTRGRAAAQPSLPQTPASETGHRSGPQRPVSLSQAQARQIPRRPAGSAEEIIAAEDDPDLLPSVTPEQRRAAAGQFERANQVIATKNFDYGIHLLQSCCQLDPANLIYRQMLRRLARMRSPSGLARRSLAWLTTLLARAKLKAAKQARDHLKVLEIGEKVLARIPDDVGVQMDMAGAAEDLGLINLAVWILDRLSRQAPRMPAVIRALARLHEKRGDLTRAIGLWELLVKVEPSDGEAHAKIKDLAAMETIARGQYQVKR